MATLLLEIVTPIRTVYSQDVNMVIARTVEGDIGVMAGHIPLVTVLVPGVMRIRDDSEAEHRIAISGGFLEISPDNRVTVLAQTAEKADEIDIERARQARARAAERLSSRQGEIDLMRAELAMKRALARLQAADAQVEEK